VIEYAASYPQHAYEINLVNVIFHKLSKHGWYVEDVVVTDIRSCGRKACQ